ncbi:MAG: hypothetical protein ACP5HU_08055 [Phycisphaerae bacterium]
MRKLFPPMLLLLAALGCGNGLSLSGGNGSAGPQYTILLRTFRGPDHVNQSRQWKDRTSRDTGWSDLYVVHRDDHSLLHRGRYPTIEAAQDELQQSKQFDPGTGIRPYTQAIVVPLPGEQVGPPEWHLSKMQGEWTVKVAIFYDVPEQDYVGRKQFAVDYCERLRENGYEAFYAHGPAESNVYIGDFPASAVVVGEQEQGESLRIRDPQMQQILDDFPQLAVNGSGERIRTYDPQTKQVRYMDRRSHPVRVGEDDQNRQ